MSTMPGAPENTHRQVVNRSDSDLAAARCTAYAVCSELIASPHDLDPRPSLREKQGIGGLLAKAEQLDACIAVLSAMDLDTLRREYSGLFEVGNDGPPVAIREDLSTGQRAGTREDLIRFYDYFGYVLAEGYAWAPDHLSVELEFMHFLCFREASAKEDRRSFQLAQADFASRHFAWLDNWAADVLKLAPESVYATLAAALAEFVAADLNWQLGTILPGGEMADGSRRS